MPRQIKRLGWIPDLPDQRDHFYPGPFRFLQALPPELDLRPQCPAVYDQGPIGSCTANAIAAVVEFDRLKTRQSPDFIPSRLFIYYNERALERTIFFDAGAQIRDGIKSVSKQGVCPEPQWPYEATPPLFEGGPFVPLSRPMRKPTSECYREALKYRAINYQRLTPILNQLKACLAEGFPFVFGFALYESFFTDETRAQQKTVIPLPGPVDKLLGGHAVVAVGYDDSTSLFIIRNSWGPDQGEAGYFYMPYSYLSDFNLCDDFWTIRNMHNQEMIQ